MTPQGISSILLIDDSYHLIQFLTLGCICRTEIIERFEARADTSRRVVARTPYLIRNTHDRLDDAGHRELAGTSCTTRERERPTRAISPPSYCLPYMSPEAGPIRRKDGTVNPHAPKTSRPCMPTLHYWLFVCSC